MCSEFVIKSLYFIKPESAALYMHVCIYTVGSTEWMDGWMRDMVTCWYTLHIRDHFTPYYIEIYMKPEGLAVSRTETVEF